jgi:hypothetical protein
MSIETLGEACRLSWRVRARCLRGTIETPVRLQRCEYTAELDMQTLVWAKGLRFLPLGRLGSRLTPAENKIAPSKKSCTASHWANLKSVRFGAD